MAADNTSPGIRIVEDALILRPKTVKGLLTICRSKNPDSSEQEILDAVKTLTDEGRMVLRAPRFESFGSFLFSPYWNTNLLAVLAVSIFSGVLYFVAGDFPWTLFQIVPGLLLLFYLPGHSLLRILLGQRTERPLERLVSEIAASIVAVMLLGLLLNFSGLGLFSAPALVSVIVLNVGGALWAAFEDFSAGWLRAKPVGRTLASSCF